MEAISSDDSCDAEMKDMKTMLNEFGMEEENLSKEEMRDLLKALNDSKSSAKQDELLRKKVEDDCTDSTIKERPMKRKYLNVIDRRMPWSVLPNNISQSEKARALAVYIKLMSINSYRRARLSSNFASWPPPIQILEESSRVQPARSTRSGRAVPVYAGFDDDSTDLDFVVTKTKKRKINSDCNNSDGIYTDKVISLKRKSPKDANNRLVKESKLFEDKKIEPPESNLNIKILADIED